MAVLVVPQPFADQQGEWRRTRRFDVAFADEQVIRPLVSIPMRDIGGHRLRPVDRERQVPCDVQCRSLRGIEVDGRAVPTPNGQRGVGQVGIDRIVGQASLSRREGDRPQTHPSWAAMRLRTVRDGLRNRIVGDAHHDFRISTCVAGASRIVGQMNMVVVACACRPLLEIVKTWQADSHCDRLGLVWFVQPVEVERLVAREASRERAGNTRIDGDAEMDGRFCEPFDIAVLTEPGRL